MKQSQPHEQNRSADWRVAVALTSLAALIRFAALGRQSLWDDEMFTLKVLAHSVSEWRKVFGNEGHPPFYFLQLRLWSLVVGSSLAALRANSAAWGTASVAAFYRWLSIRRRPRSVAILGAALLAVSPFHVAYSQEMRPYALATFLGILGFLAIDQLTVSPSSKRWWGILLGVLILEPYTHYWGAFLAVSQCLYAAGQFAREPVKLRRLAIVALAATVSFVPWIPILRQQIAVVKAVNFWVPEPSALNLVRTFIAFTSAAFSYASSVFFLSRYEWVGALLIAVCAIGTGAGLTKRNSAALCACLIPIAIPFALSYLMPSIYVWYRYTVLALPGFIWILADGLTSIQPRLARRALGLSLIALWAIGLRTYFSTWQKGNMKDIARIVNAMPLRDAVIVRPSYSAALSDWYLRKDVIVADEGQFDSPEKRAALDGKTIILLRYDVPHDAVGDAFLREFRLRAMNNFPGEARLGVTVYQLEGRIPAGKSLPTGNAGFPSKRF